jgi:SGNH hydrolase-like domain, acetyltransferase AlgX
MLLPTRGLVVALFVISAVWPRIVGANRALMEYMESFERRIEQESAIGKALRPRAQQLMTAWLGAGNERVYPGRDGWLFYRPDVEYVTGRGFLEQREFERRVLSASEWTTPPQPDPVLAIVQFKRQLEARDIALVIVPTPVKPVIHPEGLAVGSQGTVRNTSFARFASALAEAGVVVFDPAEELSRGKGDQYLRTDTHWRPEAMEAVAVRLARFIEARWPVVRAVRPADPVAPALTPAETGHRVQQVEVQQTGDIVPMLDLPDGQRLYPPESVWLRRVVNADGSGWRSSRDADVLVLGDSFSNIYSLESMGWGTSAGFVEQLSYALRRPIDRILQNDDGAFATRAILAADTGRLKNTRVVVYQFAERELAFGDWKIVPFD